MVLQHALSEADELLDRGYWCVLRAYHDTITLEVGPINHRGQRERHTSTRTFYIQDSEVKTVIHVHN